ncbi:MAG: hypothetical protein JW819_00640 [Candidatus Krumholzibacteriota bacterium]|nr:hypothetical protein [Candidatus Krumholzibacteriota bacterium]
MMYEVTRDVVSDLWPLVRADEASTGSRALVDAFLAEDGAFAATLRESERRSGVMPALSLSPDAERRLLDEARKRARLKLLVVGGGIVLAAIMLFTALAALIFLFQNGRLVG